MCKSWSRPYGRLIMKAYMLDGRPRITKDTVDLEGEYVSVNYYQMKNVIADTSMREGIASATKPAEDASEK